MSGITYVTGFIRIRELEGNAHVGSVLCTEADYLKHGENLLSHPIPMILFMEPDLVKWAQKVRDKYGLGDITRVISKSVNQLKTYAYLENFTHAHATNRVKNHDPRKFTPLYSVVINAKPLLLGEAIALDPFRTPRYSWIDFRIAQLSPFDPSIFYRLENTPPFDLIQCPMMNYVHTSEIANLSEYYQWGRGKVAATFMVGPIQHIQTFMKEFMKELEWCVRNNVCPAEEQVYAVVIAKHTDLFYPYFGDYMGSFNNYHRMRRDIQNGLWYLNGAYSHDDFKALHRVTTYMRKSHEDGFIILSPDQIFDIWYKQYLASFYIQDFKTTHDAIQSLLDIGIHDEQVRSLIISKREFLLDNVKYLHDDVLTTRIGTFEA